MNEFLEISRRFREIRLKHKLTQAELAKLIGMASGSVGAIEQGLYTPNFHVLRILKKKLGVSYNYIIDGENDQDLKEENERLKRIVDKLTR
jgi:transcriptional regulator with XRE-family HTH domain